MFLTRNLPMFQRLTDTPAAVYGFLSAVALTIMVTFASHQSLWLDDLIQITISQHPSLEEVFKDLVEMDNMPPLFALIAFAWLKVAPYGTAALKFPSELAVAIGIFISGFAGLRLRNARTGSIAAALAATSPFVLYHAGWSFRAYGFFFLFSSWALFAYIDRFQRVWESARQPWIATSAAFTLLAYTHYFGILMLLGFFLGDLVLLIRRRVTIRFFLPYLISLVLFAPWLLCVMIPGFLKRRVFWPKTPDLQVVFNTMVRFSHDHPTLAWMYLSIIVALFIHGVVLVMRRKFLLDKHLIYASLLLTGLSVISSAYIYSVFISPTTSIYVQRYFVGIVVVFYLLVAAGFDLFLSWALSPAVGQKASVAGAAIVALGAIVLGTHSYRLLYHRSNKPREKWEQTAEWLMAQPDIREKNVLVAVSTLQSSMVGFAYYLTKNGERPPVPLAKNLTAKELQGVDKVYYCRLHSKKIDTAYLRSTFTKEQHVRKLPVTIYTRLAQ